jgi:hypothetical protein
MTEDDQVRYVPNVPFVGVDSFAYHISFSGGDDVCNDSATVTVTVLPAASDDKTTTEQDKAKDIDVLENDRPEAILCSVSDPANGTAEIISKSVIRYTPDSGFADTETFRYGVTTAVEGCPYGATVTVTVTPVPSPTADLRADKTSVASGKPVTLSWTSENADRCAGENFETGGATADSATVNLDETTTFTLTCTNAVGSDTDRVTVEVRAPTQSLPPPDDPCVAPEVVSRPSATPRFREVGVLRDDGQGEDLVAGDGVYTGTAEVESDEPTRKVYRVSHEYGCGVVVSGEIEVTVAPLPDELLGPGAPGAEDAYPIVEDSVTGARFVSGQVLVRFRPEVTADRIEAIIEDEAGEILGFLPILNLAQVGSDAAEGPDGVFRVIASFETYDEVAYAQANLAATSFGFPDDPDFKKQKSLKLIRALEGWLGAAKEPKARDRRNVWVIDTGVNDREEELKDSVARDERNKPIFEDCTDSKDRDFGPYNNDLHGTRVAGIAAAKTGNGNSLAGVVLDSKIIPVRFWREWGSTGMGCAFLYAITNPDRARVVNLSQGLEDYHLAELDSESRSLLVSGLKPRVEQEMTLRSLGTGLMVVAAAGNGTHPLSGKIDAKVYPAGFNDILKNPDGGDENGLVAVAHSTQKDEPFEGTSKLPRHESATRRGDWVDVAAPGVKVPSVLGGTDTGSSMAAPLIAGAAALLWSLDPDASAAEVEAMIKSAASPLRKDLEIGKGRIDIGELVLNGSIEVDARQRAKSPASWPAKGSGTCERADGGVHGSSFYKPRDRDSFLRCTGQAAVATRKLINIRRGIESFVIAVKMAGMASEEAANVTLEVTLEPVDKSSQPVPESRRLTITPSGCGKLNIHDAPPNPACSRWETFSKIVTDPPVGKAWIVFRAERSDGVGQVDLLLDQFRIKKVK